MKVKTAIASGKYPLIIAFFTAKIYYYVDEVGKHHEQANTSPPP